MLVFVHINKTAGTTNVAEHVHRSRLRWNRRNIAASRLRQHGMYRPLLKLYRRLIVVRPVRTILA